MKRRLFTLTVFAMASVCLSSCIANNDVRASLSIDRDSYRSGEDIFVTLVLENTSSEGILLPARMALNFRGQPTTLRDVYFVITTPSGHEAEFSQLTRVPSIEESGFIELGPGGQRKARYDLSLFYVPFQDYATKEYGQYTVQAVYENESDPGDGRSAWKGKLTSNTVTFTLEP